MENKFVFYLFVMFLFSVSFLLAGVFAQGPNLSSDFNSITHEIGGMYFEKDVQDVEMPLLQYLSVTTCPDKQLLTFQESNFTWTCSTVSIRIDQPISYVIYQSDNTTYAKNAKTALIEYSGVDAKTVIQNTINALPANGGKILVNNGTYTLSGPLLLKSNTILEGESWSAIIKLGNHVNTKVIGTNKSAVSNIIIRNLQIDGNKANQDAPHYPKSNKIGIELLQTIDTMIDHVYVHDTDGMGISFSAIGNRYQHHWLVNSYVKNPNGDCYYFGGTKSVLSNSMCEGHRDYGIVITGCKFCVITNSTTIGDISSNAKDRNDIYGNGVSTDRSTDNTAIIGNTIINSPRFGIGGSIVGPPDRYSGHNVLITDNEIRNAKLDGINITDGGEYIIANNVISDSGGYGISINLNNTKIVGNHVEHNSKGGITIVNSNNTSVGFNIVKNNGWSTFNRWDGVSIYGIKNDNIQILKNVIYDDQTTKTQRYGINKEGSCEYCSATSNIIYGSLSDQIHGTFTNTKLSDVQPGPGFVKVDQTQTASQNLSHVAKIYGKVNDPLGGKVVLYITNPDGIIEQNEVYITSNGDFYFPMIFSGDSLLGKYEINAQYQNSNLGSILLNVTSSQIQIVNDTGQDISIIFPSGSDKTLPPWIKTVAKLWSQGQISDSNFDDSLKYLLKIGFIEKPQENQATLHHSTHIPIWFKNNVNWWADEQLSDNEFAAGMQYLLDSEIIQI